MTPQRKRAVEIVTERCRGYYDPVRVMEAAYDGWECEIVAEGLLREASGLEMPEELYLRIRSFLSAEGE